MTEVQEINDDLKICDARIAFFEVAGTREWRNEEVGSLRAKIDALEKRVSEIEDKHTGASEMLKQLHRQREVLLRMKSINTDAAVKRLLKLQREMTELQDVDAS